MNLADRAVRITEYQSTEAQRDSIAEQVLVRILSQQHTDPAGARDAIQTAVVSGDLEEREEGRYAVPTAA